jgi:hypothetical protein
MSRVFSVALGLLIILSTEKGANVDDGDVFSVVSRFFASFDSAKNRRNARLSHFTRRASPKRKKPSELGLRRTRSVF